MKYFVAVPTYNGGDIWKCAAEYIIKNASAELKVHIIDSGSKDSTVEISENLSFDVTCINSSEFNHGGTRNQLANVNSEYDVVIFLTQDAIPEPGYLENILSAFDDPGVGCAYGRQLPHKNANPIAEHARFFNYPERSHVCSLSDVKKLGLKTVFMSNSFSAYRIDVLKALGGFPSNTILCEDMYFTAKAVLAGYKVAYISEAMVRHSHNYSPVEEFKRYFDIGVFHAMEPWINDKFGGAGGEGKKYIFSELNYLLKNDPLYIPKSLINNFMKISGYKLGRLYKFIPRKLIKFFSMHKNYWYQR